MILMKTIVRDKAHVGHAFFFFVQEIYMVQSDALQKESLMENPNVFSSINRFSFFSLFAENRQKKKSM